jgi:hypothetical protein
MYSHIAHPPQPPPPSAHPSSSPQNPVSYLLHVKRRCLVIAYLHTAWSLPFDVVFNDSVVSSHGLIIDLIYVVDIFIQVAFNKLCLTEITGADYFRTKGLFKKKLGSSFVVDATCLFPYYVVLIIVTVASIDAPAKSWLFFTMRLPQLVSHLCTITQNSVLSTRIQPQKIAFLPAPLSQNRIRLLKDFFREMEVSVDIDVRKTALVKYVAMILGAAHWLGCIWWSLASFYDFDASTWVARYCDAFLSPSPEGEIGQKPGRSPTRLPDRIFPRNSLWLMHLLCSLYLRFARHPHRTLVAAFNSSSSSNPLQEYISTHGVLRAYSLSGILEQYLLSYYWGFQSLTNLGYSDLIPDNAFEMCFAWFLCVFQVSFYAYILGTLFSYVVKRDDKAEFNRKYFAALQSYCKNRNIPKEIYDRLFKYFEFQLSKSDNENENDQVVKSLPNALLAKVANYKYKNIVLRSTCFHEVGLEFLTSVMELLVTRYLMPNERLFNQGDMSREVCFVERGSLQGERMRTKQMTAQQNIQPTNASFVARSLCRQRREIISPHCITRKCEGLGDGRGTLLLPERGPTRDDQEHVKRRCYCSCPLEGELRRLPRDLSRVPVDHGQLNSP